MPKNEGLGNVAFGQPVAVLVLVGRRDVDFLTYQPLYQEYHEDLSAP